MSDERDVTRIVRSWLRTDEHESGDRVLAIVLDQLDATPQRRLAWPARRIGDMNLYAKLAIAAAVVVVAVLGINLLPGVTVGPGPAALPAPTPSPTPATTPTPTPTPPPIPATGDLEAGTYSFPSPSFTRRPFTVTVPDGWKRELAEGNFIFTGAPTVREAFEQDGVIVATWLVSHVYRESCDWEGTLGEVQTTDDLVRALADQVGHETTGPTIATIGGRSATRFGFSVPAGFDSSTCDSSLIRLWPDAGPDERYGLPIRPGQTVTAYVVDLDGQPQLLVAVRNETSSVSDALELEQVLDSIRFE